MCSVNAKPIESLEEFEDEMYRLFSEADALERNEGVQYRHIVKSLIKFLKLYRSIGLETDFTVKQVIELTSIFQRVIRTKTDLLKRLLRIWVNLQKSKTVVLDRFVTEQRDELTKSMEQMSCLKEFSVCVNLKVIETRLSSSKVRVDV